MAEQQPELPPALRGEVALGAARALPSALAAPEAARPAPAVPPAAQPAALPPTPRSLRAARARVERGLGGEPPLARGLARAVLFGANVAVADAPGPDPLAAGGAQSGSAAEERARACWSPASASSGSRGSHPAGAGADSARGSQPPLARQPSTSDRRRAPLGERSNFPGGSPGRSGGEARGKASLSPGAHPAAGQAGAFFKYGRVERLELGDDGAPRAEADVRVTHTAVDPAGAAPPALLAGASLPVWAARRYVE